MPPAPTYRLYGLDLATHFRFATQLPSGFGRPDLAFACVSIPPMDLAWRERKPEFASPGLDEDDPSGVSLYRLGPCDVVRLAGAADYYLWQDRIACHATEPGREYLIEIHLLGPVLAFWLERAGIPVLHAAAVAVDGRAIAFVSSNRGGKSALAATMMQSGCALLSDDVLSLERQGLRFVARAAYPAMRMWPEEARYFVGRYSHLPLVHEALDKRRVAVGPGGFGAFCDESFPLGCLYLPQRKDPADPRTDVEILPVSPRDAVIALVRFTFTPHVVEALGWQPRRLAFFADLAARVPIRRLIYPSGLHHLPRVSEAILQDVASLT